MTDLDDASTAALAVNGDLPVPQVHVAAASRRAWKPRPAHARSSRESSSPVTTGAGLSGTWGGFSPAVSTGALICDVYPGAPADAAGLAGGDVITSINGTSVSSANSLTSLMANDSPGSRLSIGYVNENGTKHTATVTLTEWAK